LLSFNTTANINLTIQSDNNNIIKITDLNNYNLITSNITNESINLPYSNYILKFYPDINHLDNSTVISNLNVFNNDRYKFIWIMAFFGLLSLAYIIVK
jgi:hypothetical protein